jgi:acyl carrier protein
MESVENRIKRILEDYLGVDRDEINNEDKLRGDVLLADDLDIVEIVMEIEDEFNIEITDEEIEWEEDYSVQYLIDLVENKLFG